MIETLILMVTNQEMIHRKDNIEARIELCYVMNWVVSPKFIGLIYKLQCDYI